MPHAEALPDRLALDLARPNLACLPSANNNGVMDAAAAAAAVAAAFFAGLPLVLPLPLVCLAPMANL